jgi:hypothetical protein
MRACVERLERMNDPDKERLGGKAYDESGSRSSLRDVSGGFWAVDFCGF